MNFRLTFKPDEKYYSEAYSEIISSFRFKKYEPLFASIMIFCGVIFYLVDDENKLGIFPFVFGCLGVYELYKVYYEKKKWLKDRLDSRIVGQVLEIEFTETSIKHSGPFSSGEFKWDGLKDIVKTKNGILLRPENGVSVYLPSQLFTDKDQINFILSKKIE